jgi:hypothetical protein
MILKALQVGANNISLGIIIVGAKIRRCID